MGVGQRSMALFIEITVDTNDGDYMTAVNEIEEGELKAIRPLIEKIKAFTPRGPNNNNYPYGECLREDLGQKSVGDLYNVDPEVIETFEGFTPYSEYGFHTITSITVYEKINEEVLI